jgi:hypothetical protein
MPDISELLSIHVAGGAGAVEFSALFAVNRAHPIDADRVLGRRVRLRHDGVGVLQDIPWSSGYVGYFPD